MTKLLSICIGLVLFTYLKAEIVIPFFDKPPVVDGRVSDKEWDGAPTLDLVGLKGDPITKLAQVRVAYDQSNLYFLFINQEPVMKNLRNDFTHTEERDVQIWSDDVVEMIIDPYRAEASDAFHILTNARGIVYDAHNRNTVWNPQIKILTSKEQERWIVEVSLPFRDIGYTPQGGERWDMNFARQEKQKGELSNLVGKEGEAGFIHPSRRKTFIFGATKKNTVELLGFLKKGEPFAQLQVNNFGTEKKEWMIRVNSTQDGSSLSTETKKISLDVKKSEKIEIPYIIKTGTQLISLDVFDLNLKKSAYKNRIEYTIYDPNASTAQRYWKIEDPLYTELLGQDSYGIIKNTGMPIFGTGFVHFKFRTAGLQYGFPYSEFEYYQTAARDKIRNVIPWPTIEDPRYPNFSHFSRQTGSKACFYPYFIFVPEVPTVKRHPFLYDPRVEDYFLKDIERGIKKYGDIIESLWFTDEQSSGMAEYGVLFYEEQKETYPFILQVNETVKKEYGYGKWGIPENKGDRNPFRWIAWRRWLADRQVNLMSRAFKLTKQLDPKIVFISEDPQAVHQAVDYSRWKGICDLVTHQLFPRKTPEDYHFGFITKHIADLSGVSEIWPCPHVEEYAGSFTPEETVGLLSQMVQNGATGMTMAPVDAIGMSEKKKTLHDEEFGAPDRWKTVLNVIDELRQTKKPIYPKADHALLYSTDTIATYPMYETNEELPMGYTLLGPSTRGWFDFISDYQIERKEKNLNHYKAIYIATAKYQNEKTVRELMKYVEEGGTLVSLDPEVFSFFSSGDSSADLREKLFGIEVLGSDSHSSRIQWGEIKDLVQGGTPQKIKIKNEKVTVIGSFEDGTPAIVSNTYGKGKAIYFASSPCFSRCVNHTGWRTALKKFQISLGIQIDQKIWRYQLPMNLAAKLPSRKNNCLTNNYVEWRQMNPIPIGNIDTKGTYQYEIAPDAVADISAVNTEIPFEKGKLTNRRAAANAGNVDYGIGKIEDWIVTYDKELKGVITYNLQKPYQIEGVSVTFSGILPSLKVMLSDDGKNWREVGTYHEKKAKETSPLDVRCFEITWKKSKAQYMKLDLGVRELGETLSLAEIDIFGLP